MRHVVGVASCHALSFSFGGFPGRRAALSQAPIKNAIEAPTCAIKGSVERRVKGVERSNSTVDRRVSEMDVGVAE